MFPLRNNHLLLILLILYYQHHILQWRKIVQVCHRSHFSFDSLHWVYFLFDIIDRNRTLHAQLTPLSDVTYVKQGRISQLPSHCKSKHYYIYQNKCERLFFCLTLIICIDKNLTHIQNCCVLVDTKHAILNMIHQPGVESTF